MPSIWFIQYSVQLPLQNSVFPHMKPVLLDRPPSNREFDGMILFRGKDFTLCAVTRRIPIGKEGRVSMENQTVITELFARTENYS